MSNMNGDWLRSTFNSVGVIGSAIAGHHIYPVEHATRLAVDAKNNSSTDAPDTMRRQCSQRCYVRFSVSSPMKSLLSSSCLAIHCPNITTGRNTIKGAVNHHKNTAHHP